MSYEATMAALARHYRAQFQHYLGLIEHEPSVAQMLRWRGLAEQYHHRALEAEAQC